LEYGSGWFSKNADAGLSRIDYSDGNRPPKVGVVTIEKTSGSLPFTLNASVEATDPEKETLTYKWLVGNDSIVTKEPKLNHTINKAGDYMVKVEVSDPQNARNISQAKEVYAGNEQPTVTIELNKNKSFYFPGKPVEYSVLIADKGDSTNKSNLFVSTDYIRGIDRAEQAMGHQVVSATIAGKNLMLSSDCKSCHKEAEKSIGPAYKDVAQKYIGRADANPYLVGKIIKGSTGVWGENAMPAHPTMKEGDAALIVQWILSLANKGVAKKTLPPSGKVVPVAPDPKLRTNVFTIQATYTDNGSAGIKPLTNSSAVYLRNNTVPVSDITETNGFNRKDSLGVVYLAYPQNDGWVKIPKVDLTGISAIELVSTGLSEVGSFTIELRSGRPDGERITNTSFTGIKNNVIIQLPKISKAELQDIYVVYKAPNAGNKKPLLRSVRFLP
jgi:cytochrome c551/c552